MRIRLCPNRQAIFIQACLDVVRTLSIQPEKFTLDCNEQCLYTGAKIYYRGGGWWKVSGYAHDGDDTQRVARRLIGAGAQVCQFRRPHKFGPTYTDYALLSRERHWNNSYRSL